MRPKLSFAALAVCALSCGKGVDSPSGAGEPIMVRNAEFRAGPLPSTGSAMTDAGTASFRVTSINSVDSVVREGEAAKGLNGEASLAAATIGVRFDDLGSGYWVFPVDAPDPIETDQVTWALVADFGANLPPGIHYLDFVPFDANAGYGAQTQLKLCVPDPLEGLHSCSPKIPGPEAAISITWDVNSDVDLHVVTPEGVDIDPKNASSALPMGDAGLMPDPKTDATLDRDSNGACVIDGVRREDLIWPVHPASGRYHVRADLFAACGQAATTFTVSIYAAQGAAPNRELVLAFQRSGVLLAQDEDAGGPGLFVTDFDF